MAADTLERLLTLGLSNAVLATALALLALGVSRLYRCPPLAHALWLLVLLKLLSPPLLEIPSIAATELPDLKEWLAPATGSSLDPAELSGAIIAGSVVEETILVEPELAREDPAPPPEASSPSWIALAAAIAWLGGALLVLAAAVVRIVRFDRLLRWSQPAPERLSLAVSEVSREMGLDAAPAAIVVDARLPPLLWTWRGQTRVVFPAGLLNILGEAQLRALVAHELAHLRRRDHWLRWLELVAVALYWWLPVAWWSRRELRRAEEECCDGWVQRELSAPVREYARALLKTIDFLSGVTVKLPRTASALGEASFLRRRFQMILERSLDHRLSTPLRALWIAACLAVLPWAASGALGQKPDEAPVKDPTADSGDKKPEPPPHHVKADGELEHRLSRMEGQLAELMAEIRSLRGKGPAKEKPSLKIVDGAVESIDPSSGKVRWKTELKGSPHVEVQQKGDRLVVTDPKRRKTVVLDSGSGKILTEEYEGEEGQARAVLEAANAKLRAEKKQLADGQHRKAREVEREAKDAAQREYKEALRVKGDIARIEAERAKLLGQLKKLDEQRAVIKEQLQKLEQHGDHHDIR
jgi:beta-lactamase regulating signal transducer with metallopeptidase domain